MKQITVSYASGEKVSYPAGVKAADVIGRLGPLDWPLAGVLVNNELKSLEAMLLADCRVEPVTIGTVTISTGDYILGDRDGLVVIPAALAEEAVTRTEAVSQLENKVRDAIRGGMDPVDAYLKFGKF